MNRSLLTWAAVLVAAFSVSNTNADTTITYADGDDKTTPIDTSLNTNTTLTISSGAAEQSGAISGANTLIKTGAGSLELAGGGSAGRLHVQGGEIVLTSNLTVTGGGGSAAGNYNNNTMIGMGAEGSMVVKDGAKFSVVNALHRIVVGANTGGVGTLTVDGTGSNITVGDTYANAPNNSLHIGYIGTGTVNIQNGATAYTGWINCGSSGGTGTLNVTGTGSLATVRLTFYIGATGNVSATTNILNGGKIKIGNTQNTVQGQLVMAEAGTSTLNISGAGSEMEILTATASTGWHYVGYGNNSSATINITEGGLMNANTTYANRFVLGFGTTSQGTLNINTGGSMVTNSLMYVGYGASSTGHLEVKDEDSSLSIGGTMYMAYGASSTGTVDVKDGGKARITGNLNLGNGNGSIGTVNVSGEGLMTVLGTQLLVGQSVGGTGNINVTEGGVFDASAGNIFVGATNTSAATVTIDSGGVLKAGNISLYRGTTSKLNLSGTEGSRGVLETESLTANGTAQKANFDGGILRSSVQSIYFFIEGFLAGQLELLAGGLYLDSNGNEIHLDAEFSGVGGLTKIGDNDAYMHNVQVYTGSTVVEEGSLIFLEENAIADSANVHVESTLDLRGEQIVNNLTGTTDGLVLGNADITLNNTETTVYYGEINNTGFNLIKDGVGSLLLSGGTITANQIRVNDGTIGLDASNYVNTEPVAFLVEDSVGRVELINSPTIAVKDVIMDVVNGDGTLGLYNTVLGDADLLRADADSALSLVIGQDASFSGKMDTVNAVNVDVEQTGTWIYNKTTLAGSATSFGNLINNGHIIYKNDGWKDLSAVSLAGNGTFTMGVDLTGNVPVSDTLTITGANSATGNHTVILNAKHSLPIPEELNHLMISTKGGDAVFTGSVDIGMKTASLYKGDGVVTNANNWYLSYDTVQPEDPSSVARGILGAAEVSLMWFTQNDSLMKRMGELRMNQAPSEKWVDNAWVRGYGAQYNVDSGVFGSHYDDTVIGGDLGLDKGWKIDKYNTVYTGGFGGYGNSDKDYKKSGTTGSADTYYFGAYGTFISDDGTYADLVVKAQSFDNEFTAHDANANMTSGSYNNWAFGTSLEFGQMVPLTSQWYIEPQAQFSYVHVVGADYSTEGANPFQVHLDDNDIFQIRYGANLGYVFRLQGDSMLQPYAKLEGVYQTSSNGDVVVNGETWETGMDGSTGRVGCGVIWQMNARNQMHFSYEAAFGEKYDMPWSVTLGYRYQF